MHRFLFVILLVGLFAMTAWSQEDEGSEADDTVQPETEEENSADVEEQEENVVDDEYYQDVDDKDFRPSEDIPADQSISFPTDI